MDAFFASVAEHDNPWLSGSPIVIGADPAGGLGRGVVSTSNYLARSYGIKSAMPISRAWRLSEEAKKNGQPGAIFLGSDFKRYEEISEAVNEAILSCVGMIERAGIDESYADFSMCQSFEEAEKLGRKLKSLILEKTGLTASLGIGPNKLVAKIASDLEKPDGLTVIRPEEALQVLGKLSIRKIPGIGPKTEELLLKNKIKTVRDVHLWSEEKLVKLVGKWGKELYQKVRGIDDSPLEEPSVLKSIGEQETFEVDTLNFKILLAALQSLVQRVLKRFEESGFKSFRTMVLSVRFADFETKSRSKTFSAEALTSGKTVEKSLAMFMPFFDKRENPESKKIRMLGFRLEKFTEKEGNTLF